MPTTYTPRGFAIYAEFVDSYGSTVRVQESSSASGPHAWIFQENAEEGVDTPHLNVPQAQALRDALDEFISHAKDTWDPEALEAQTLAETAKSS